MFWNKKEEQKQKEDKFIDVQSTSITIRLIDGKKELLYSTKEYDGIDPQEPWKDLLKWFKEETTNTFDLEYGIPGRKNSNSGNGVVTIIRDKVLSISCDIVKYQEKT